jgi:hypothetical protein
MSSIFRLSTTSVCSEDYLETTRLLDSSIVVGSQSAPLAGHDLELMSYYADAFEKGVRR